MSNIDEVTIAILAKDKSECLNLYLECILNQTYPKNKIHLYIRTNNNNDNTADILEQWIEKHGSLYKSVYYDNSNFNEEINLFKNHEWNKTRFKIMSQLRQESINYALKKNSHYFVVDCDNFIIPQTLEKLISTKKEVIGPLLHCQGQLYSNYHHATYDNGYYKNDDQYYWILNQKIKGIIKVDVIHCTYFIQNSVLKFINYSDNSERHEYVIFSDNCRKQKINQYIDNEKIYGYLTFLKDSTRVKYDEISFKEKILKLEKEFE